MSRSLFFLSLLCLATILASTLTSAGSLRGTVRDAATLDPLEGANVTVHVVIPDSIPYPTTTDVDGEYLITGIIPNNEVYAVIAYKNGYSPSYTRIDNLGSQDLVFEIFLDSAATTPPGGGGGDSTMIAGAVMAPSGDGLLSPVPDATVTLHSFSDFVATTDPSGFYGLTVPRGSYTITVAAAGYDSLSLGMVSVDTVGARVNAVLQSTAVYVEETNEFPHTMVLYPNYPNPFNPSTWISFSIPRPMAVRVSVVDALGRQVRMVVDEVRSPGDYRVLFDATGLADGVYFCRLEGEGISVVQPMLLLK